VCLIIDASEGNRKLDFCNLSSSIKLQLEEVFVGKKQCEAVCCCGGLVDLHLPLELQKNYLEGENGEN